MVEGYWRALWDVILLAFIPEALIILAVLVLGGLFVYAGWRWWRHD